jgi:hypothetical protein
MGLELLFSLDPSIIMEYMNSLFASIFQIAENPTLQQWGDSVISQVAESTERQVTDQLGYNPLD